MKNKTMWAVIAGFVLAVKMLNDAEIRRLLSRAVCDGDILRAKGVIR